MKRHAIFKKMMKTDDIWLFFPAFSFFWWAVFWHFYENHNGNSQYDVFINCTHYSAFDTCAWCLSSHNSLVEFERHLYPTPYIVKGRNNRISNTDIADVKWLAQIITKSLYGAIPSMIMFFKPIFHNPISHGGLTKCKMVAEIVDFDQ